MQGEKIKEIFRKNLIKLLLDSRMSKTEFSKKMNVSPSTVSMWLNGENSPKIKTLAEMAELFKVDISYFLTDHEAEYNNTISSLLSSVTKTLENESAFLTYLDSIGYETYYNEQDELYMRSNNDNIDFPLTAEEYNNLKNSIKNTVEVEIYRIRKIKGI